MATARAANDLGNVESFREASVEPGIGSDVEPGRGYLDTCWVRHDPRPMSNCCDPRGCDRFFGKHFARRVARRYRKHGLGKTEQAMVEFLESADLAGATVLEVGGGVGELHVELLKRGAERAVNLELSPAYDGEARRLLAEARLEGRVERRIHDIAVAPEAVERADVVVLHRVVCCYPDYERLLGAAGERARRLL